MVKIITVTTTGESVIHEVAPKAFNLNIDPQRALTKELCQKKLLQIPADL